MKSFKEVGVKYLWTLILAVAVFAIEPGDIAINEVCFDPDGADEEWIELRNNLDIEITLDSTVTISDGEGIYHFEGIMIPEGGFITLMSRTDGSFPFEATLDITEADIQLANGSDEVILMQGETVIDSFKYHSSWTEDTYTLERINPTFFAIHPGNWSPGAVP